MIVTQAHSGGGLSVRRLAKAAKEPVSTVGRWVGPRRVRQAGGRKCPVSGDASLCSEVRELCDMPRHRTYGYRRIWALLRRRGHKINKETVRRMMRRMGLSRPKICYKPKRPKRVEKMRPVAPNRGWQIDMTSFVLSDMTTLYLVVVTDCYTRRIVGWSLERRCRAGEWVSALRMALESQGLMSKELCCGLVVRSDNGSQPCSKKFVEYLGKAGVRGQYTGYNAPDDNAYVERVIRTVKEEEIWPNLYDSVSEARAAIEDYVNYYNNERIHSALGYQTPSEFAAAYNTLVAA
jgi:putative transposase